MEFKNGDIVKIKPCSKYPNGKTAPTIITQQNWKVIDIQVNYLVLTQLASGGISIRMHPDNLDIVQKAPDQIPYYKMCKSLSDERIKLYSTYELAKRACDLAGPGYSVFNDDGHQIYTIEDTSLKVGDMVSLKIGAVYSNGRSIPDTVINSKLILKEIKPNEQYVFGLAQNGKTLGSASSEYFVKYGMSQVGMEPYTIITFKDETQLYAGPGNNFRKTETVAKHMLYTIIDEQNGFGRLKMNLNWIDLNDVSKVK